MYRPFVLLFVFFMVGCGSEADTSIDPAAEEWIQLFDGESLNGWTPKITGYPYGENYAETFKVVDGAITVAYDGYEEFDGRFGHLFYETPFSHYLISVEYRFTGEQAPGGPGWAFRNSGIMVHSPPGASMLDGQDFPISIEVQLLGGNGTDDRTTSNLCTPGTHVEIEGNLVTRHCVNSTSKTYHGDDWVTAEVLVLGDSLISHRLEGDVVLEYQHPQIGGGSVDSFDAAIKMDGQLLSSGYISLQSESHPVEFRTVELLNLRGCTNSDALNYKSYFVSSDDSACTF
jgi:hypothetical protein